MMARRKQTRLQRLKAPPSRQKAIAMVEEHLPKAGAGLELHRCGQIRPLYQPALAMSQRLQGEPCLHELPPQPRLIAVEAVENRIINVGKPQERVRQSTRRIDWRIERIVGLGM